MKLLFVTDTMSSGGSERVLSILVNNLCKDHDVDLLCLRSHAVFYRLEPEVNVIFADDHCSGMACKYLWFRRVAAGKDLVIAFMLPVYIFALASLLFSKIPIIVSERNAPQAASLFRKVARRLLIFRANRIVVQTVSIKDYFPAKLRGKIEVIDNPISSAFNSASALHAGKKNLFITVGRLQKQKNQKLLLDAFCDFSKEFPDFRLDIYGEGELRDDLQRQIEKLGLETKVELKGRCEHLDKVMPRAKAFVMSSDYEGTSNAMLEAMYIGLPVISTRVSGATELIRNDVNGYLVGLNDRKGLTDAFKKIALSPDSGFAMGKAASDIEKLIRPERVIAKWKTLIEQYRI